MVCMYETSCNNCDYVSENEIMQHCDHQIKTIIVISNMFCTHLDCCLCNNFGSGLHSCAIDHATRAILIRAPNLKHPIKYVFVSIFPCPDLYKCKESLSKYRISIRTSCTCGNQFLMLHIEFDVKSPATRWMLLHLLKSVRTNVVGGVCDKYTQAMTFFNWIDLFYFNDIHISLGENVPLLLINQKKASPTLSSTSSQTN